MGTLVRASGLVFGFIGAIALTACAEVGAPEEGWLDEGLVTESQLAAPACSAAKVTEVLAAATPERPNVRVACSLSLPMGANITKKILIEGAAASGTHVRCNGATLGNGVVIRSLKQVDAVTGAPSWLRPTDVVVQDCTIYGQVHVYGMAPNGEGVDLRDSSRSTGHTQRAQVAAPTRITLAGLDLIASGSIPLYVGPGVTSLTLVDSELSGQSNSVAIYFDAESASNAVMRNYIHTATLHTLTNSREVLALDGSAYNRIVGNTFSALNNGGIYLYRNCGEGGTIRHQTAAWNQIVNNIFYYNQYDGTLPAVWVASRNGNRSYCGLDAGYPLGSSSDDRDLAQHTVIAENRFYKFAPASMIRLGNTLPQYIFGNETATTSAARPSGCFVPNQLRFLNHNESAALFSFATGAPACTGMATTCFDGGLITKTAACPTLVTVGFECSVAGNNAGCGRAVSCPAGQRVVAVKAACNLEYGSVTGTQVAALPWNTASVHRASDVVSDGRCIVGTQLVRSGSARLVTGGTLGESTFEAGCAERDSNGGDCHMLGQVWCGGI